jgi:nucleoside-diphosphate-sugar epimerase
MKVILFGGTGLMGSYIAADLCEQGHEVTVYDIEEPRGILRSLADDVRIVRGDVGDADGVLRAVKESGAERVVHSAAMLQFSCEQEPRKAVRVNVDGTVNVLEAARQCGVERVVYASSAGAYGVQAGRLFEDMQLGPWVTIYGITKLLGEGLGNQYSDSYGYGFVALRYSLTYGPGTITSPGMAKVMNDILSATSGKPVTIPEARGDLLRQPTYVRDSAAATVLALMHEKPSYRLYNVASSEDTYVTLQEISDIIHEVVPEAGTITFTGEGREIGPMDTTRIRENLGFEPRYGIAEGVRAMVEDQRKWW